uniref:ADAM metallopeptidase domain 8 n=1 Tax=Sarcophilus harrisii TaxID=9305 RepID=A0A7N4P6H2_SARHA
MLPGGPCFWGCLLLLCLGRILRECRGFSAPPPLPTRGHLPHVERYEVVQPLRLPISGATTELSSSPAPYPETIRYLLGLRGNNFTLHLRRNRHLMGSDYTETHTLANGTEVTEKPQAGQPCFYQGHVEGHQNSVASISICRGIRGFFKAGSTIHLIEPLDRENHGDSQEGQGGAQGQLGSLQGRHDERLGNGTDAGYEPERGGGGAHTSQGTTGAPHSGTRERQGPGPEQDKGVRESRGTTESRRRSSPRGRYVGNEKRRRNDQGKHVIYRQQDLKEKKKTCGVGKVSLKGELETMMAAVPLPQNWIPGSAPKDTHYVELFVVVDNVEYNKYKSLKKMRQRVKEIINHVDRLYQEINFRVVLTGLEIWDKGNKAPVDTNIETTLSSFLKWRVKDLVRKKQHDNAQLISGVSFGGAAMGLARLASMCTEGSGGVSQDFSANAFGVATTLAHEMGHNLGMDHDENIKDCQCDNEQNGGCVMTSKSGTLLPKKFSSCSKYNLQKFLGGNIFSSSCLNNFPVLETLEEKPVCGNKFLEKGEECDCGFPEECSNQCCNAKSCRLAAGAECTEGECCQACQVLQAGEVCREAQSPCDLAEYCDGKQSKCPENVYKENGTPCWQGYCYNGSCPTYSQQCQALWGMGADVAKDKCFLLKLPKGCTEAFFPSRKGLDMCGYLFCARPSHVRPTLRHLCSFLLEEHRCDLAITQSEYRHPFVMVATGTKCDHKKVCFHRSCQDLSVYGAQNCSQKCHQRGVCNHKRECHCDPGWAPPDCRKKLSVLREDLLAADRLGLSRRVNVPLYIRAKNVLVALLVSLTLVVAIAILLFLLYKWKMGKKQAVTEEAPAQQ